ncbi:unnamed protein product [Allacma fusca]|uniref:TLC domain-containing protein n=1 Tax=Allacma fusca TaxID=39272 RepID=A0A8J2KC32_9HEXA|nr:unnamed protein product [Allacma fusca]
MNNIYNYIWKEEHWLPENYTWKDFATQNNAPTGMDLVYPIFPVAVSLIFLRSFVERYYLKPLGKRWGVGRTKLNKFSDSGWRFICYCSLWTFGFLVLVQKPWFSNSHYFWKDFPLQGIDNDVWWYYTLVVGYYWSLVINQFSEGRRKDFWMMFAHHVITLSLLCFSWMINITRIGSMFNLIHDIADVPLEEISKDTKIFL